MIRHNTLEANITLHCNNRCAACNHGSPFHPKYEMTAETLARDLAAIGRHFHSDEFWLVGGEPLLHPNVPAMAAVARASKVSDRVGVLTNGRLLRKMDEAFWKSIDMLTISVYPNLEPGTIEFAEETAKQHGVTFTAKHMPHFFKIFGQPNPQETFDKCHYKNCCWTVHEGYFYLCPESAFFPENYMSLPLVKEGLPLDEALTEQLLADYTNRKKPFTACNICDPLSERFPWHEVKNKAEFVKNSTRTAPVSGPIVGGDRSDELVPMDTDGGGKILVEPSEHPDFPHDGKLGTK